GTTVPYAECRFPGDAGKAGVELHGLPTLRATEILRPGRLQRARRTWPCNFGRMLVEPRPAFAAPGRFFGRVVEVHGRSVPCGRVTSHLQLASAEMAKVPFERTVVDDPAELGLDVDKVAELLARAQREVDAGHTPSCQLAIARDGRVGVWQTLGDAAPESRYVI